MKGFRTLAVAADLALRSKVLHEFELVFLAKPNDPVIAASFAAVVASPLKDELCDPVVLALSLFYGLLWHNII